MKRHSKVLSFLLALMILLSVGVYSNAKTVNHYLIGDVDFNGTVSATDARLILRVAVELDKFTPEQKRVADFNKNGHIGSEDARMALRTAVDLEPEYYEDDDGNKYLYDKDNDKYIRMVEGYYSFYGDRYESYDAIPEDTWYYHYVNSKFQFLYKPKSDQQGYTLETDPYYYMCDDDDQEGCKARVGLYYNVNGIHCDYDDIAEGDDYFYYAFYNGRAYSYLETKPYSPGNEPEPVDDTHCQYCGKPIILYDGEHFGCWYGGCSRWMADITCPDCGAFVKANTCHTCKH